MIQIPLSQGLTAIVDDEDAHLAGMRWYAASDSSGYFYARRTAPREGSVKRSVFLHREVLGLQPGDKTIVDHINGDRLDCRRANLRIVTNQENMRNRGGAQARTASGFMGVYRSKKKWQAKITIDGWTKCLGTFATPEEANVGRLQAEREIWGIQPRRIEAFRAAGLLKDGSDG